MERSFFRSRIAFFVILAVILEALGGFFTTSWTPLYAQDANLNYTVDVGLAFIDRLGRPEAGNMIMPAALEQPRTLGLSRFRAAMTWRATSRASLNAVLRPDAQNVRENDDASAKSEIRREFDRRSGASYRAMPSLQLLDAYQIDFNMGSRVTSTDTGLSVSAGVWEELSPLRLSYPEVLGFGLQVRLPAKFSAARLRWQSRDVKPPEVAPTATTGFQGDLYVLEGSEDRSETMGAKRGTFDQAPVGKDPYHGVAGYVGWMPREAFEFGVLVGSLESAAYQTLDGTGDNDGALIEGVKRSDFFAELVAVLNLPMRDRHFKLTFDFRNEQEKWSGPVSIASRVQQSMSLSTATSITPKVWFLFGTHLGKSERAVAPDTLDKVASYSGYQVESGFLGRPTPELSLSAMAAQESRERSEEGGDTVGGFADSDGNRKVVRRFGLELAYLLNQNK